ncbi:MAG: immunity 42 family protein [Roseburia sp.]|nr:immunity 42 family protein [Roseburia sp.]
MQKLIGEKKQFAIQFEIVDVINQFVYGHICYWINEMQIGDFTSTTILSDVLVFLPQIVKDNGNRKHERFFDMKKEEVCYLLGGQAYLDSEKYEEIALKETWARFNIELRLDVFNGVIINLIDDEKKSRIVFSYSEGIYEFYLERGVVDNVLFCFYKEFDALYEELIQI